MPAEIELKLTLDRAAAGRAADLARHPAVLAVRSGRLRTTRVVSTYYDTPDFALGKAGVALRLRRDGARWLQTVKGPPLNAQGGALHAHDEFEWQIGHPRLDLDRIETTPWHKVFRKARKRGALMPLFVTDVVRRALPLAFPDGTTATLAIDVGAIRTRSRPSRRSPVCEIEIEIRSGSVAPLFALALALLDDWPLSVAVQSKASRGYALVRGDPDGWREPVHAEYVEIAHDARAYDALRAIARGCLRQIAANAPGLLAETDPEWVHQMRIGTRRLRSCLSLIGRIAGAEPVRSLVGEVRWLAGILGTARDWDVLATDTMPPLAVAFTHDPVTARELQRLTRSIGAHRNAARRAAREAVQSQRFQRLLLSIGAFCAQRGFGGPVRVENSARDFASELLSDRDGKLRQCATALEHGTEEERHAVRIAAKKLRYVAEFFSPPEPGRRNRHYLKVLSRLQDALGRWQDTVTASRLMAGLTANTDRVVVGAVRGWGAAQAVTTERDIAGAWRQFDATERFWTRR